MLMQLFGLKFYLRNRPSRHSPLMRVKDQINRYYGLIHDRLEDFEQGYKDKVVDHEKNLFKAFEIYMSSLLEEKNYYKSKLKEHKRKFKADKTIKSLKVDVARLEDELSNSR